MIQRYSQFLFFKCLELACLLHFVEDFSPSFIFCLTLLLAILANKLATNFEINISFLIRLFSSWQKIQGKHLNILRKKRAFNLK